MRRGGGGWATTVRIKYTYQISIATWSHSLPAVGVDFFLKKKKKKGKDAKEANREKQTGAAGLFFFKKKKRKKRVERDSGTDSWARSADDK